jgi:hypothetical protein
VSEIHLEGSSGRGDGGGEEGSDDWGGGRGSVACEVGLVTSG